MSRYIVRLWRGDELAEEYTYGGERGPFPADSEALYASTVHYKSANGYTQKQLIEEVNGKEKVLRKEKNNEGITEEV